MDSRGRSLLINFFGDSSNAKLSRGTEILVTSLQPFILGISFRPIGFAQGRWSHARQHIKHGLDMRLALSPDSYGFFLSDRHN